MRGRRFAVRPSRDTCLVIFYVVLFFGFWWFWWYWAAQNATCEGCPFVPYIVWPVIAIVSVIPLAIAAIINDFRREKRISLAPAYFITYVALNLYMVSEIFDVFFWIS